MTPAEVVRDGAHEMEQVSPQHAIQLRIIAGDVEKRDLGPLAAVNLIKRRMHPKQMDGELRTCAERLIRTLEHF